MPNVDKISTSKSIPEMNDEGSSQVHIDIPNLKESYLNTSLQTSLSKKRSEIQIKSFREQASFDQEDANLKEELVDDGQLKNSFLPKSIYLVTVNPKSELVYTLLSKDKKDISEEIDGTSTVVHTFSEIITRMMHFPCRNGIILCGSPHIFFWNVPNKQMIFKYKIKIPLEPWFTIWDSVYIPAKQSLILGLNNGFVVQLKFDRNNLSKSEQKVFQSNEEGNGIYGLAYFPSTQKIIATNGHNLLTEFIFQKPKKQIDKEVFLASSKNISDILQMKDQKVHFKSIKNISLNNSLTLFQIIKTESTKKNK